MRRGNLDLSLEVYGTNTNLTICLNPLPILSLQKKKIITSVFNRYDSFNAWDSSTLSHEEFSWKQAREGLAPDENGNKKLSLKAIKVDAKREMLRRKGIIFA